MARYHLNWKGEPGVCKARKNCPFGDIETEHFSSADDARAAFESQHAVLDAGVSKKASEPKPDKQDDSAFVKSLDPEQAIAMFGLEGDTDQDLEDRKTEIFKKDTMADIDHLEIAAIVSLQETRRKATPPKAKKATGWQDFKPVEVKDSKIIAKPKVSDPTGGYMGGSKWVGGKVPDQGYLGQKEAAKSIRADIKEAIKQGELPKDLSYSVRMNSGSWVTSISIIVGEKNEAGKPVEVQAENEDNENLKQIKTYLESLGNQYSTDESNSMYDYFNSSNRARVTSRSKWDS